MQLMTAERKQAVADTAQKASAPAIRKNASIDFRDYGLLAALVVVVLLFQIGTGGKLLAPANVNNLIMQNAYVVILALAMIGGFVALAIQEWHMPVFLAVFASLVLGALRGAWKGNWVAFVGIPGFITTLAGMLAFRGGALIVLTGGTIGDLSESFVVIGARWMPSWLGHWFNHRDGVTLVFGLVAVLAMITSQLRACGKLKARGLPREALSLFVAKNAVVGGAILYLS
jgi:putative multiple sugar transport system permease protein